MMLVKGMGLGMVLKAGLGMILGLSMVQVIKNGAKAAHEAMHMVEHSSSHWVQHRAWDKHGHMTEDWGRNLGLDYGLMFFEITISLKTSSQFLSNVPFPVLLKLKIQLNNGFYYSEYLLIK